MKRTILAALAECLSVTRFDGKSWVLFGEVISAMIVEVFSHRQAGRRAERGEHPGDMILLDQLARVLHGLGGSIYAGWALAAGLVEILKQSNGDLTSAGIMKAATHLADFHLPGALPGLSVSTSPDNYQEFQFMRDMEFSGERWVLLPAENM